MIDIVVMTCERLPLLMRTLEYIRERTTTPYRLQVVDDASTGGNAQYLRALQAEGKVARARLHTRRVGISSHLRSLTRITASDPIVFTDDDILCPKLEPDWLARGLDAMQQYPKLGLLALNMPGCNLHHSRHKIDPGDPVTFCRYVGGTFVFARRAVLASCHVRDGVKSPVKALCRMATEHGWRVGYLTEVYCQHTGAVSVRKRKDLTRELERVLPVDGDTLEPPDAYKG